MSIKILCVGDVVGRPGRVALANKLPELIRQQNINFVVVNAENAAGGSGLTPQIFKKLQAYGVDVVTLGDHAFRKGEIVPLMRSTDRIVRPANLSPLAAGRTWTVVKTRDGLNAVGVVCLLGQMYMGANDSPWQAIDTALRQMPADVKIRVVDFHAEASSEKIAMGWHLNGRVSVVFGTHTHIPTADARVLDQGHGGHLRRRHDRPVRRRAGKAQGQGAVGPRYVDADEIRRGDGRPAGVRRAGDRRGIHRQGDGDRADRSVRPGPAARRRRRLRRLGTVPISPV